jgi:hypothetical protein
MKKNNFYGSGFFSQKTRYAYGYDTSDVSYVPDKKDIRLNYYITGAELGLASSGLDSTDFAYDFGIDYSFFLTESPFWQHSLGIRGEMAKMWNKFYAGANTGLEYYKPSDTISADSKYIFFVNPFIKKSTREWDVKLGFNALIDKGLDEKAKIHIYPDVLFGFNIIPAYVSFFAELSGRMDRNEPLDVISQNPFLLPGVSVYRTVNTDYALVVRAGFSGETGIDGTYKLSASYSLVNDMLLFSNYNLRDGAEIISRGNYFNVIRDQAEILNVHGDYAARVSKKIAVEATANYYRYTLSAEKYPWNKPGWDASFAIKYMLQDKIIAGAGMNALGKTQGQLTSYDLDLFTPPAFRPIEIPAHLSFRLSAEYRFTKILSFWFKADNISFTRAYEWAFYPTQRFICLLGFSYSL